MADEWIVMIDSVAVIWPKASPEGHAYSKVVRTSMADPNCDTITTIYTPRTLCRRPTAARDFMAALQTSIVHKPTVLRVMARLVSLTRVQEPAIETGTRRS